VTRIGEVNVKLSNEKTELEKSQGLLKAQVGSANSMLAAKMEQRKQVLDEN
jgi:hypothetical protein